MSKTVRWAGYSITKTGDEVSYDFHTTNNQKNQNWMDMPVGGKSLTTVFTFFEMPPNTDRQAAKKLLHHSVKAQGNPNHEGLIAMLGSPSKRSARGSISKSGVSISPEEQERKKLEAHLKIKSAIE
jgi:hypothetical protein